MYLLSQILPKEQAYIEPVRLMLISKGMKNVDLIKLLEFLIRNTKHSKKKTKIFT